MNVLSIPVIITFTVNASIFLLSLLVEKKTCDKRWFSVFAFLFVFWNFSEFLLLNQSGSAHIVQNYQTAFSLIFVLPSLLFVIIDCYLPYVRKPELNDLTVLIILLSPLVILSIDGPVFEINVYPVPKLNGAYFYHVYLVRGWKFYALLGLSVVFYELALVKLVQKLLLAKSLGERARLIYFTGGMVVFIVLFYLLVFSRHSSLSSLFYLVLFYLSPWFFYYLIVSDKLFSTEFVVKESLAYIALSSIIATFYFLVIREMIDVMRISFNIKTFWLEVVLIFSVIVLIYPLKFRIQQFIDKILYKNIELLRQHTIAFVDDLYKIYDNQALLFKISEFVVQNFDSQEVVVLVKKKEHFVDCGNRYKLRLNTDCFLANLLERLKGVIEFYSLDPQVVDKQCYDFLLEVRAALIFPVFYNNKVDAIIILSEKKNEKNYTFEEIRIIKILINELSSLYSRNKLIGLIKFQEERKAQMERLATIGRMTSTIAHEIRNPLNTISVAAQTLLSKELEPEQRYDLEKYILEETQRLNNILNDLLQFSRLPSPVYECFSVSDFAGKLESYIANHPKAQRVDYRVVNKVNTEQIVLDQSLLLQIFINLINNALDAIDEKMQEKQDYKGRLLVLLKDTDDSFVFVIHDNGQEIDPQIREKIFEPFYTTKVQGTGLGLAISQNIAKAMDGEILLLNHSHYKRFMIKIPKKHNPDEC